MEEKPKRKINYQAPSRIKAIKKYQEEKTQTFKLRLSLIKDADISAWLDQQENKGQYLRALIRADMERNNTK